MDFAIKNFKNIREHLSPQTKICCVIKANAYGHGAVFFAKLYERLGADYLAVSNIEEALQVRKSGVETPILNLGYCDPCCAQLLHDNEITQCVYSREFGYKLLKEAEKNNVKIKIHIKIDTGMHRIGFQCDDSLEDAAQLCKKKHFIPEGVFTHFASSDEGTEGKQYTKKQFDLFMNAIAFLEKKGVVFEIRHCANSAAVLDYEEMHLDMVRVGIILYGFYPSQSTGKLIPLKPVLTLKSIISHIKVIHKGDTISYGRRFEAKDDMVIATIPIGYADGFWRANSKNHFFVEVEGQKAAVLGTICMDQCMIDITNIKTAGINSVVTIYDDHGDNSIDNVAVQNGTISYEILCAIGERVPRFYFQDRKSVFVLDNLK